MTRVTDPASLDVAFDVLSDSRRRDILEAVADHNPRDVDEFTSGGVASADENGADPERVRTELHHVHLPKLAAQGYVEWDPNAETIRRGPNFDDIAPLLRLLGEYRERSPED